MKKLIIGFAVLSMLFTLGYSQSITVTFPEGSGIVNKSDPLTIRWQAEGSLPPFVKIRLYNRTGTTKIMDITDRVGTAREAFPCAAGFFNSVPDGNYLIRVKTTDNAYFDDGGVFTLGNPGTEPGAKSIIVSSPDGRDLALGSSIKILWRANNLTNNQTISLWKNGALFGIVKSGLVPGRISESWEVGRTAIKTALPDTGFTIRVEEQGTGIFGESNTFSIVAKRNIDLSCYISEANATRTKRSVYVTVKVRCNNFSGIINDIPVKIMIRKKSDSSLCSNTTKIIPSISYQGHSHEYEVKARLSYCRLVGLLPEKFVAVAIVDPDDIFSDRSRLNNTDKKDVN